MEIFKKDNSISQKEYLNIFVEQFQEFIQDIAKIFPNDRKIILLIQKLYIYSKVHQKTLIETWRTDIVNKYREQIEKKNYDFFVENDWEKDNNYIKNIEKIDSIPTINDLRITINQMNESNKIQTFKYIENLTKLCDLYYS